MKQKIQNGFIHHLIVQIILRLNLCVILNKNQRLPRTCLETILKEHKTFKPESNSFSFGPNNDETPAPSDFELMTSEVTNLQYQSYLKVAMIKQTGHQERVLVELV